MSIAPYIFFSGNCAEAMTRYQEVLGGELQIMTHADVPPGNEMEGAKPTDVMHAALTVGGALLMASDDPSGDGGPKVGISVTYTAPDTETARRVFDGLAEGGSVDMPLEETFWSPAFGGCTDRFGVQWLIDTSLAES